MHFDIFFQFVFLKEHYLTKKNFLPNHIIMPFDGFFFLTISEIEFRFFGEDPVESHDHAIYRIFLRQIADMNYDGIGSLEEIISI